MLQRIFIYQLKYHLKAKSMLFWNILLPLVIFGVSMEYINAKKQNDFEKIPVAVVEEGREERMQLEKALEEFSMAGKEGRKQIFAVSTMEKEEARQALKQGEIAGYITAGEEQQLVIAENGGRQEILRLFLDSYQDKSLQGLMNLEEGLQIRKMSKAEPNMVLNYFYCLMAVFCLNAALAGIRAAGTIRGDESFAALRQNAAPIHKSTVFWISFSAGMLIQQVIAHFLFLLMWQLMDIDFGSYIFLVLLANMVGVTVGMLLGAGTGLFFNGSVFNKQSCLFAVICVGAILCGLIHYEMKYTIEMEMPFLNYINPVYMLEDAYYSLYFYADDLSRYWSDLRMLMITAAVLWGIVATGIRRREYEGI